uniref:Uncharacterized protein n=1 Tax=Rhizophora mucronata TaxID=61149 RepID=A0A2P2Q1F4_RHIMU
MSNFLSTKNSRGNDTELNRQRE